MIVRLLLPMAVALAAAYVFDLGRIAGAALVGAAFWLGMKLAGRPMPLQFSAFAMFAAVTFGFMAAVFASFTGKSVYEMLAAPLGDQFVGIVLACAAVAFAALALVGGLWTMLFGGPSIEQDAGREGRD
jgi:hypothetical protein